MPTRSTTKIALRGQARAKTRLSLLRKVRGLWKGRTPKPLQELRKIRSEWERGKTR